MLYGAQPCPADPAARSQNRRRNGSPDRVPCHGWNQLMSAVRTLATNDTAMRHNPYRATGLRRPHRSALASGQPWGDPVAGLAITALICHVDYQVTADVVRRLADGVDPSVITTAEVAAASVPGVQHAHARARFGPGGRCGSRSKAGQIPACPSVRRRDRPASRCSPRPATARSRQPDLDHPRGAVTGDRPACLV